MLNMILDIILLNFELVELGLFFLFVWVIFRIVRNCLNIQKDMEAYKMIEYSVFNRVRSRYDKVSGCYVILIYKDFILDVNIDDYIHAYVGKSVNIGKTVSNRINTEDILSELEKGEKAYVRVFPCSTRRMDFLEKRLIRKYLKKRG